MFVTVYSHFVSDTSCTCNRARGHGRVICFNCRPAPTGIPALSVLLEDWMGPTYRARCVEPKLSASKFTAPFFLKRSVYGDDLCQEEWDLVRRYEMYSEIVREHQHLFPHPFNRGQDWEQEAMEAMWADSESTGMDCTTWVKFWKTRELFQKMPKNGKIQLLEKQGLAYVELFFAETESDNKPLMALLERYKIYEMTKRNGAYLLLSPIYMDETRWFETAKQKMMDDVHSSIMYDQVEELLTDFRFSNYFRTRHGFSSGAQRAC